MKKSYKSPIIKIIKIQAYQIMNSSSESGVTDSQEGKTNSFSQEDDEAIEHTDYSAWNDEL